MGRQIAGEAVGEPPARLDRARRARRDQAPRRRERDLPRGRQVADREGRRQADRRPELPRRGGRPEAAPGGRPGAADGRCHADREGHAADLRRRARRRPQSGDDDAVQARLRSRALGRPLPARSARAPRSSCCPRRSRSPSTRTSRRGSARSAKLRLVNVAPKLGLDFRQGAFRYSMAYDQQAMMGGGVCWIDYNNDGWLDLFAVNSYADVDLPDLGRARGHAAERALRERAREVRQRHRQVECRHPREGHRLRGRRPERRRLHRPRRHLGDRRRHPLEQRQRDVHDAGPRRRPTAGTRARRSRT